MVDTSEETVDSKLPSTVGEQCTCGSSKEDVVSGLSEAFDLALQVEDSVLKNVEDSSQDDNGCSYIGMAMMGGKNEDFEHIKAADIIDNRQEDCAYKHVLSLPVAGKLISAMKGGHEKEGLPPRKLSVSWAPDVYDPPPSSVSHLPKRNNQSYRNSKHYLKGKQKSKTSSHGSRSKKDKHHHHHHHRKGGETPLGLAFSSAKNLPSNYRPSMELHDGDECDIPDSGWGISFMRKSCGFPHLTYDETT